VRIITDLASNLSPALIQRYGITLLASRASAKDIAAEFRVLSKNHREMLVVCSSRKLAGTHDAAMAASRALKSMPSYADIQVSVVDTSLTDLGTGLITLVCAESVRSRRTRKEIADAARALGERSCFYFVPQKSSGFIQGLATQLTGKLPIMAMHDGSVRNSGTTPRATIPRSLVTAATKEYPLQQSIFAAILHGASGDGAAELEALLREHYDVKCLFKRQAVYSDDALGCVIMPIRGLPWQVALAGDSPS
jgi:fatty acid-binding protein DegV